LKKIADSKKDKIDFQEKGSNAVTGDNSAASTALAAANPSASCSCTVASTLSGSNNEEKAWNFLVSKGFSAVQAAGAMGNLKSEGNFIPEQLEIAYSDPPHKWDKPLELPAVRGPAGQPGLGIAQWTSQGRKEKLLEAAKHTPENEQTPEIEQSVINLNVQLNYLWTELSESYKAQALDPIMKSSDLAEVVHIWQDKFEVGANFEPRFKAAQEYMTKFGSNAAGSSSPSSDSSSASSSTGSTQASGGGCGSTSGGAQGPTGGTLSWPIDPKASFVTQCYGGPSGHPGMDISTGNVDGHPIFAAADGVVTDAYDSGADAYGPNYVVIDHGNGLGTSYGHMRSMSVKKGDQVKQGQQIGEEGNLGYSKGTHLHFNAFPTPWPKNDSKNFNPLEHGLAVPSTVKNPHGCK
jgi:murein DD-endopeptidase MepM/ murein hydrolase activator NlpD